MTNAFVGTLGKDPELRYTTGGAAVANFSLAISHRYKKNDEWQEETTWLTVTAWRELAENVAASLQKGSRVIVTGRLQQRSWETQDGERRTVIELLADEIGPSLRWATAIVERTERENRDDRIARQAAAAPEPIYDDEEPF